MSEDKTFEFGKITGERNFSDEFQMLEKEQFDSSKKTLLIFPGNPTSDVSVAERYARCAALWLDGLKDKKDVQVCSMIYSNGRPLMENGVFNFDFNYDEVVNTFFMPYFVKNGERVSEKEAIDNIKKLVVFTHSAGAVVMNECMALLENKLKQLGYSADEVANIYSNFVMIAHSPYSVVYSPIKAVYVSPVYDSLGSFAKTISFFENTKTTFSRQRLNIRRFVDVYDRNIEGAIAGLQGLVRKFGAICMTDEKKTLNILPDVLFERNGFPPEDHGIAGIINYPLKSSEQTRAGAAVTKILCEATSSALERSEREFDIFDLYCLCSKEFEKVAKNTEMSEGNAR